MIRVSIKLEEHMFNLQEIEDISLSSILETQVDCKFGNTKNQNLIRSIIIKSYTDFVDDIRSKLDSYKQNEKWNGTISPDRQINSEIYQEKNVIQAVLLDEDFAEEDFASQFTNSIHLTNDDDVDDEEGDGEEQEKDKIEEITNKYDSRITKSYHKKSPLSYRKGGSRVRIIFPNKRIDIRDNIQYPQAYLSSLPKGTVMEIIEE